MNAPADDIELGSLGTRSALDKLANRIEAAIPGADGAHAARIIRSFAWLRSRLTVSNNAKLRYLHERSVYRDRAEKAERDAERWRVARNNTGDGLRLIRWNSMLKYESQVWFPSPALCDADADAAITAIAQLPASPTPDKETQR